MSSTTRLFSFTVLLLPVWLVLSACQSGDANSVATLPDTSFQLDTSFNGTGILSTPLSQTSDTVLAMVIQADGKIITAGSIVTGLNKSDLAVVRYNPDGSLDSTFNPAGMRPGLVTTAIGGGNDVAYGMVLQGDGKIVVAGSSVNTTSNRTEVVVARYNTDGSLDATFNPGGGLPGTVTTVVTTRNCFARGVALHGDGRIVVAGQCNNGSDQDIAVVQYNSDGSLDTGFNGTGMRTVDVMTAHSAATPRNDIGRAVRVQGDDRIVVAGVSRNAFILRFNDNGTLDNGFGDSGSGVALLAGFSEGNALVIQPNGMLLVGGASNGAASDMAVARLDTTGVLDPAFGMAGVSRTGFLPNRNNTVASLALLADGRIVGGGGAASDVGYDFAVIRMNTDGTLDTTFGLNGKATTSIGFLTDTITAVAIQSTGEIVAAGGSWTNNHWARAIVRYLP